MNVRVGVSIAIVVVAAVAAWRWTSMRPSALRGVVDAPQRTDVGTAHATVELRISAPAPPAEAPRGCTWTGRVLEADGGAPVADALVRVTRDAADADSVEARSGADGSFRLDGLMPGESNVVVGPRELAAVEFDVHIAADMRRDVFVAPGVLVTGRVLDGERPVAGARVVRDDGGAECTTGSDGVYRISGVGTGDQCLHVAAPGFEEQDIGVGVPAGRSRHEEDLVLQRVWRVRGRVLAEGKPVPGAKVSFFGKWSSEAGAVGDADMEGAFELATMWRGEGDLLARAPDGRCGLVDDLKPPADADADVSTVDIELSSSLVVTGLVREAGGDPVASARVRVLVLMSGAREEFEFASGPDGRFQTSIPAGRWSAGVTADGFFTLKESGLEPLPRLPAHTTQWLELEMRRDGGGGVVDGRVVDSTGAPVPGVKVWTCHCVAEQETTTDAAGAFVLRGLPDERVQLGVSKPGFVTDWSHRIDPAPGRAELVIDREAVVRGVVLLPDGVTPAKLFEARLYFEADRDGTPWKDPWWPFKHVSFNDAQGRFEFRGVTSGTIRVEAASGLFVTPRQKDIVLREGAVADDVRLVLAPGARIAGRVVDSARRPIANLRVWGGTLTWEGENCRDDFDMHTDADGRFEAAGLVEGDYMLHVNGPGAAPPYPHREVKFHLEVGARATPEVVLLRPGGFDVKAVDPDGKAIEKCWVGFVGEDGDVSTESWTGKADDIEPGRHLARVRADGFRETETTIEVEEGKTATVVVTLQRE